MAQRQMTGPAANSSRITVLEQRLTQLQAVIDQQQADLIGQRAEIAYLHKQASGTANTASLAADAPSGRRNRVREPRRRTSAPSSRRELLKWSGAAAAAATVTLMASEGHSALAAPMSEATDGSALIVGQSNTSSLVTDLVVNSGAKPSNTYGAALMVVDASAAGQDTTGGVYLAAGAGTGLYARSSGGSGLHGTSGYIGVAGDSPTYGVVGSSTNGYGVAAYCTGTGVDLIVGFPTIFGGYEGQGRLQQILKLFAGAPTTGFYNAGEQIRDENGELWLCTTTGAPGTWVRAAHVPNGYSGGGTVVLSQGIRLLDTRGNDNLALNQGGGPYNPAGSPYHLSVAGVNWQGVTVPGSAVAAIGLVTAVPSPSGGGYIALVPQGTGFSGTASLAYNAGLISGASFTVGLSGGAVDIIIGGYPVDVVIDLFAVIA